MTDRLTDAERRALIAGDDADALGPDQVAELDLLAGVLADASTWVEPGAGVEDAVVAAVLTADDDAGLDEPVGARTRPVSAHPSQSRSRLRLVLAAAAAVVIVAAIGGFAASRARSSADYRGQLAATSLSPGAAGSVDVVRNDAGFRITLDASGLPPLQGGEYYQAWLKNAANTLVPIGTFSSSDGQVVLWSGVSPTDYPTLTVTIEDADNQQASSGRRVLVGDLHTS
jgi:hypothetical protein